MCTERRWRRGGGAFSNAEPKQDKDVKDHKDVKDEEPRFPVDILSVLSLVSLMSFSSLFSHPHARIAYPRNNPYIAATTVITTLANRDS